LPDDVIQKSKVYAEQEKKPKNLPKKSTSIKYRKLLPHETQILEEMYQQHTYLDKKHVQQLQESLPDAVNNTDRIMTWFTNRRKKDRASGKLEPLNRLETKISQGIELNDSRSRRFTENQTKIMAYYYKNVTVKPDKEIRMEIEELTGLTARQISNWFKRHREGKFSNEKIDRIGKRSANYSYPEKLKSEFRSWIKKEFEENVGYPTTEMFEKWEAEYQIPVKNLRNEIARARGVYKKTRSDS